MVVISVEKGQRTIKCALANTETQDTKDL